MMNESPDVASALSRRRFLQLLGAATAGMSMAGPAAADHPKSQPESVEIVYDETTLERYKPRLVTSHLEYKPNALYAWLARSAERSTSMAVYWTEYDAQNGKLPFRKLLSDSHHKDHEPVYVEFADDTGDVVSVHYSAYHWLRATAKPSGQLRMDGDRPLMHVVKPWHQTRVTDEVGADVQLSALGDVFKNWRDNGLEDALEPGTVYNPWRMATRGHWWRDTAGEYSKDALLVKTLADLSQLPGIDIGGYSASDYTDD